MSHCHDQSRDGRNSCEWEDDESCRAGSCDSECGEGRCDSYAEKFLHLAEIAWCEVLKERIKEHIRTNSKHIDELAALISEASHEKWHKKIAEKHCKEGFEDKLRAFFNQTCKTQGQQCNQPQGNQTPGNQKGAERAR